MNEQVKKAFEYYWSLLNDNGLTREQAVVYSLYSDHKLKDPALSEYDVMCMLPRWRETFYQDEARIELSNDETKSVTVRAKQLGLCWKRYIGLRAFRYISQRNQAYINKMNKFKNSSAIFEEESYIEDFYNEHGYKMLRSDSQLFKVADEVFYRSETKQNFRNVCMLIANEELSIKDACEVYDITPHQFRSYIRKLSQAPQFIKYLNYIGMHIDGINELK